MRYGTEFFSMNNAMWTELTRQQPFTGDPSQSYFLAVAHKTNRANPALTERRQQFGYVEGIEKQG